jgi:hypothetical protein
MIRIGIDTSHQHPTCPRMTWETEEPPPVRVAHTALAVATSRLDEGRRQISEK